MLGTATLHNNDLLGLEIGLFVVLGVLLVVSILLVDRYRRKGGEVKAASLIPLSFILALFLVLVLFPDPSFKFDSGSGKIQILKDVTSSLQRKETFSAPCVVRKDREKTECTFVHADGETYEVWETSKYKANKARELSRQQVGH